MGDFLWICFFLLNYLFLTHIHAFVIFYDNGKLYAKCSPRQATMRRENMNKEQNRVCEITMRKSTSQFVCECNVMPEPFWGAKKQITKWTEQIYQIFHTNANRFVVYFHLLSNDRFKKLLDIFVILSSNHRTKHCQMYCE